MNKKEQNDILNLSRELKLVQGNLYLLISAIQIKLKKDEIRDNLHLLITSIASVRRSLHTYITEKEIYQAIDKISEYKELEKYE